MTPYRQQAPLQNCIHCGLNPRRTWSRHYACRACLKAMPERRSTRVPEPEQRPAYNEIPF